MTPLSWHFTTWLDLLDHWQTIIAGVLALAAAFGTILVTRRIANRQIAASREAADRVIAATRAQTEATFKQTEATVRLEELRNASEGLSFHAMLAAAMTRVLAEAAWARSAYPALMTQTAGSTVEALAVRNCITKGAFAELRGACVRQGGPLTGEFLDLEGEIDNFALQFEDRITNASVIIRMGKHAGLGEQLALIEKKATALREGAFDRLSGSAGTAPPRRSGAAVPGSFATVEAEALIGAPAPPISEPEPRRSLLRYWFGWRAGR